MKKEVKFKVEEIEYTIRSPSFKCKQEARKKYRETFAEAVRSGALLRASLGKLAKDTGALPEDAEDTLKKLQDQIKEKESVIKRGGIELDDGRVIAMELLELRDKVNEVYEAVNSLDGHTAEHEAEVAQDLYLISQCLHVDKTPYLQDYSKFIAAENDPVIIAAIFNWQIAKHNLDEIPKTIENDFLMEYNFVDSSGNFIDADGNFVSRTGSIVQPVIEEELETKPFLKDGQPVGVEIKKVEAEG